MSELRRFQNARCKDKNYKRLSLHFFVTLTTTFFGRKLRLSSGSATIIQKRRTEVEASHLQLKYKFYKLKNKFYYCVLECLISNTYFYLVDVKSESWRNFEF